MELIDIAYKGALIAGAYTLATFGFKKFTRKQSTQVSQAGLVMASVAGINQLIEKDVITGKFPRK